MDREEMIRDVLLDSILQRTWPGGAQLALTQRRGGRLLKKFNSPFRCILPCRKWVPIRSKRVLYAWPHHDPFHFSETKLVAVTEPLKEGFE